MDNDVLMRGSPLIMPGEQSIEVDDTFLIRGLNSTKVGRVEPALPLCTDATVLTSGVARPNINQDISWLTSVYINELEFKM